MNNYNTLSHTKWKCKYHVVIIPKYRRKVMYGRLRNYSGKLLRRLALEKGSEIQSSVFTLAGHAKITP